ncbi:substrate-binding domain-containing protein [Anaerovoracaceae bacterium SGI.195]
MKKSKVLSLILATAMLMTACIGLTACGDKDDEKKDGSGDNDKISVISREEGSGTRGAFIELVGVEEKNDKGEKEDRTVDTAVITNSTSVAMTSVSEDKASIGYISLASLNDTVKALKIDGVEATVENIQKGKYPIARNFNLVTKDGLSPMAEDFMKFILSEDGQKTVSENGYIDLTEKGKYEPSDAAKEGGKLTIGGSSSVTPLMEKLAEAYKKINPKAEVMVQQSDSTTGVTSAIDGSVDIGMASRDLKDSETSQGVKATVIAKDGIAVIVHKDNKQEELKLDQVKDIFTGKITKWSEVSK